VKHSAAAWVEIPIHGSVDLRAEVGESQENVQIPLQVLVSVVGEVSRDAETERVRRFHFLLDRLQRHSEFDAPRSIEKKVLDVNPGIRSVSDPVIHQLMEQAY
jgi:hypothetical protein